MWVPILIHLIEHLTLYLCGYTVADPNFMARMTKQKYLANIHVKIILTVSINMFRDASY